MVKTGWQQNCRPVLREENEKERNDVKNWKNILVVLLIGMMAVLPAQAQKKDEKSIFGPNSAVPVGRPADAIHGKIRRGCAERRDLQDV